MGPLAGAEIEQYWHDQKVTHAICCRYKSSERDTKKHVKTDRLKNIQGGIFFCEFFPHLPGKMMDRIDARKNGR